MSLFTFSFRVCVFIAFESWSSSSLSCPSNRVDQSSRRLKVTGFKAILKQSLWQVRQKSD
jgi:hypothetical protein